MVPEGWGIKKLGELCSLNPKKPSKPNDGIVSFIAMPQISESGIVISTKDKFYDDVSKGFTSFVNKDVLLAKITPCFENGKGALVDNLVNGIGFGSTEFHVLRANKGTHPEFIYYLTRTTELRVRGEMNMQGSAGHRRVTTDYFNTYKVLTPPLPEQRKIAKILGTWDKAITTTEQLIATSKQQKKALMQQLLTGKKRLLNPETGQPFAGEWCYVRAGSIFTVRSDKRHNSDLPMLAITQEQGAIPRELIDYNVSVTNDSIAGYKVVEEGDFIISLRSFQGGIEYSRYKGICSPAYVVLYPEVEIKDIFYKFFLKSFPFIQAMKSRIEGIRDGKIISYKYFSEIKVPQPSLKEQQKIAQVLTSADNDIEALTAKLAHLKQEKKALMQQLLTGKRRVVVDEQEVA